MMKRILVFGIGTSCIQVIIFYFFIFMVYWFAAALSSTSNNDPSGDYAVLFSAILLPIMIMVQNFIAALINNITATYILMAIAIIVYIVGLVDVVTSVPFKSGLCLVFGLVVLGIKIKIDERLRQK
jgi:hypothetical protein